MTREIVKELHFRPEEGNQVSWQVVPRGETGRSILLKSPEEADRFIATQAFRMGFRTRLPLMDEDPVIRYRS